jgi:NhaP-type Na+/H+ or K+/H+ antiporter
MKKIIATLTIGLVLLYLLDSAFKIDGLTREMLIDNLIRYILGFICFYYVAWTKRKFKNTFYLSILIVFIIFDSVYIYIENIEVQGFLMLIHDLYFAFWGVISGFFFVRYLKQKKSKNLIYQD